MSHSGFKPKTSRALADGTDLPDNQPNDSCLASDVSTSNPSHETNEHGAKAQAKGLKPTGVEREYSPLVERDICREGEQSNSDFDPELRAENQARDKALTRVERRKSARARRRYAHARTGGRPRRRNQKAGSNRKDEPAQEDPPQSDHHCLWEPNNRPHAHPRVFYRGVGYCSLSEAAFAVLLEYFIPGFDVVPGKTFQVPIGGGRSVDFCINGVLIEFHQPRLMSARGKLGDFRSERELRDYRRVRARVRDNRKKRELLDHIMHQRLARNYFDKRRAQIDQSPHFRRCELIVATSRFDFFEQVICRFALVELPTRSQFNAMFWQAVRQIARASRREQAHADFRQKA